MINNNATLQLKSIYSLLNMLTVKPGQYRLQFAQSTSSKYTYSFVITSRRLPHEDIYALPCGACRVLFSCSRPSQYWPELSKLAPTRRWGDHAIGQLAVSEINAAGGIMGKHINLITKFYQQAQCQRRELRDLIDNHDVKMVFGGSSGGVAVAVGRVCTSAKIIFRHFDLFLGCNREGR